MKIVDMYVTPIALIDPPLLNSVGLHQPYALRTIVELVTDDGVSGLGEIPGSAKITTLLEAAKEFVVGKDPFQLNGLYAALDQQFRVADKDFRGTNPWDQRLFVHLFSALEVACFDIMGKSLGRPVVDLLGGVFRERVPFAAYLFYKYRGAGGELGFEIDPAATGWAAARQAEAVTQEQLVAQAKAMCEEYGFRSLKLKAGALEPDIEVATMFALREAFGPDTPLRIDPNAVWSLETAIRCGEKMRGILEYYEDPVRGQENMSKLRKAVDIPLATNMCTTSFDDLPNSIAVHSEDIILADHHYWGGLRACQELAAICRTFGRGLSMHSNSHVGISLMAMVHLAAATPHLTYDLDTHYPWQPDEILAGGKIQFEDGTIRIPTEPGLGVELDRAMLAQLHENYIACGITERDDAGEMRKLKPDWKAELTRW
jgi:glucarate dehydratase